MKKKFAIEQRLRSKYHNDFMRQCKMCEWYISRKYETEKQRDEALRALSNRTIWEYRKKDL